MQIPVFGSLGTCALCLSMNGKIVIVLWPFTSRKKQLEEGRAKRLARLFKDDWNSDNEEEDDEEPLFRHLDQGAAKGGIDELIDKVEVHLQVEMGILRKWQEKDFAMIKEQSRSYFP